MTTPTPTSSSPVTPAPALPAGLPDEATLARLAGEFFAALPGAAAPGLAAPAYAPQAVPPSAALSAPSLAPGAGAQPSVPSASAAQSPPRVPWSESLSRPEAFGTAIPRVGPQPPDGPASPMAEPGVPPSTPYYLAPGFSSGLASAQTPQTTPPASPQAAGTQFPGDGAQPSVPAATAAPDAPRVPFSGSLGAPPLFGTAIPQVGSARPELPATPVSIPSTPYYFLGESSAYPSTAAQASLPGAQEDRVIPRSHGLPGEADLQQLLQSILRRDTAPAAPAAQAAAAPGAGASPYYFVDPITPQAGNAQVPAVPASAHPAFDVQAIRRDFPILAERVNGRPLIWFDNAATTHKPQAVIDRLAYFYAHENSNIHRAAHELAARATDAYEGARSKVARFLGAASAEEIVFVRGATEAINLVAKSWGAQNVRAGDEIIVTWLEHHANIVPWQQLAAETGAKLRVVPVDNDGQVLLDEYQKLLSDRTKLVAFTQVSNALGTVTPVREMVEMAHRAGALALVDGAQAVSHMRVNVQALDADFYVFSGHKVFAPTGIGVVYGKSALLNAMPPWQGGGNMIADVTFEKSTFQKAPSRFEAGTGNIADAVGLGAAIDYIERVGMENIAHYEHGLLVYATQAMCTVPGLCLIGTAKEKASVLSFVLEGYRPEDVGSALNREGIAVRSGHHCAQPILRRFGHEATVRPSLAFYNTCEEVDVMVAALHRLARANRK